VPPSARAKAGYDLWHTIQASVADVFVTRDERLVGLLARVPIEGFRVFTTVRQLLADLDGGEDG